MKCLQVCLQGIRCGVIAPQILTAMDRVEPMADPVLLNALPEADKNIARNLSFLLAKVLSGTTSAAHDEHW